MDEQRHRTNIARIDESLNQGVWRNQDIGYVAFLRNNSLGEELEQLQRRLLTKLALTGVYKEFAQNNLGEVYVGKVGKVETPSHLKVTRNECYLQVTSSANRAARIKSTYNASGRLLKLECGALDQTTNPPRSLQNYILIDSPTTRENQAWTEKNVALGPLGHYVEFAQAFHLPEPLTFEIDVAHHAIERSQRLLRSLADTLWNGTSFIPFESQIGKSLDCIRYDYTACNRIGAAVRLWPHMVVEGELQIKMIYEPFKPKLIESSGWARPITRV